MAERLEFFDSCAYIISKMSEEYKDKNWMVEMYVKRRYSAANLAIICGVSRSTILRWMKKHGIEKRFGDGMKVSDWQEVWAGERFVGKVLIFLAGTLLLIIINAPEALILFWMLGYILFWVIRYLNRL